MPENRNRTFQYPKKPLNENDTSKLKTYINKLISNKSKHNVYHCRLLLSYLEIKR